MTNEVSDHTERTHIRSHDCCVEYRVGDSLVWDYDPETRDWLLERRIASLQYSETDASLSRIDETAPLARFSA